MPASLLMIAVAWPVGPQIGSAAVVGVVGAGVVAPKEPLLPPHPGKVPSRVAPAEVPANTINALRFGEFGSFRPGLLGAACLPLFLFWVATDVSLPFAGVVSDRWCLMEQSS